MPKVHYTNTELPADATLDQVMRRGAICGAKATRTALIYKSPTGNSSTNWDDVNCLRCLSQREKMEHSE